MDLIFVICVIVVWILYHSLFQVTYFDLGRGCLWELMGSVVGGFVLFYLITNFWYIAVIVLVIVAGLFLMSKK